MTLTDAFQTIKQYQARSALSPEEEFVLIEAYMEIIQAYENDDDDATGHVAMFNLADYYKRHGEYRLALKYYRMSAEHGGGWPAETELAHFYYYGLTGKPDYEQAYRYASRAAEEHSPRALLILADLYRYGQFVKPDHQRYRHIIFDLYEQLADSPSPMVKGEVMARLADIYRQDDDPGEAFELFLEAQSALEEQFLIYFENRDLDLMKHVMESLYSLLGPARSKLTEFGLYDLYVLLKDPVCIAFSSSSGLHYVTSHPEPAGITVEMDGNWYRNIDDFFDRATIDGARLPAICDDLLDFRIL